VIAADNTAGAQGVTVSEGMREFHLALVGAIVAGIETQYRHFRATCVAGGLPVLAVEVPLYIEGGWIERLPLPSSVRGTLRSAIGTSPLFGAKRVDAVWTQLGLPLLPFSLTRAAWQGIPIFYAADSTPVLLAAFSGLYSVTPPGTFKGRLTARALRLFFSRCQALIPWSRWAAASMIGDYGADPARVHVIPPGVDLKRWSPFKATHTTSSDRVQLLFVGGDFERKGGPLLLDIFQKHLQPTCDLHLVTRAPIEPQPGVSVYRDMAPNDDRLLELYRRCDLLVLPTVADCFSMAAIEAMACALPVVISAIGGIPEIVQDGVSGTLIAPGDGRALLQTLASLTADASLRRRWGTAGRSIAEQRFDGARQSSAVLELMAPSQAVPNGGHS